MDLMMKHQIIENICELNVNKICCLVVFFFNQENFFLNLASADNRIVSSSSSSQHQRQNGEKKTVKDVNFLIFAKSFFFSKK
jgi:hypothetical protein